LGVILLGGGKCRFFYMFACFMSFSTFQGSGRVSVYLSVCLNVAFLPNSHGRKSKPIELKLYGHVRLYGALRRMDPCGDSSISF